MEPVETRWWDKGTAGASLPTPRRGARRAGGRPMTKTARCRGPRPERYAVSGSGGGVKLKLSRPTSSRACAPRDCSYCFPAAGLEGRDSSSTPGSSPMTRSKGGRRRGWPAGRQSGFCLVASGRGGPPTRTWTASRRTNLRHQGTRNEGVEVCACLGLLSDGPGRNDCARRGGRCVTTTTSNTSESPLTADICTTHGLSPTGFSTVQAGPQAAGMSACSGTDRGHGRESGRRPGRCGLRGCASWDPDSVPVNFLIPFEGTPLAKEWKPHPAGARACASWRWSGFVCPDVEVRLAGGPRGCICAACSRSALQPGSNSHLPRRLPDQRGARRARDDLAMIADAGFEVEGHGHHDAAGGTRTDAAAPGVRRGPPPTEAPAATVRRSPLRRDPPGPGPRCAAAAPAPDLPPNGLKAGPGPPGELLALDRQHVWHPYGADAGARRAAAGGVGVGRTHAGLPGPSRGGTSWWTACSVLVVGGARLQPPGAQRRRARPAGGG